MLTLDVSLLYQIAYVILLFAIALAIYLIFGRKNQNVEKQKIIEKPHINNNIISIYFDLRGRLSIKAYWLYWNIPFFTLFLVFYVLEQQGIQLSSKFYSILNIVILWPVVATTVKRLHDLNRSGWWFLIHFVPVIGTVIISLFLWFVPGTKSQNCYG